MSFNSYQFKIQNQGPVKLPIGIDIQQIDDSSSESGSDSSQNNAISPSMRAKIRRKQQGDNSTKEVKKERNSLE